MKNYLISVLALTIALHAIPCSSAQLKLFEPRCSEKSCDSGFTKKSPEQANVLKGEKIISDLKNGSDDKERWALVILYSGSGDNKVQSVDLIKGKRFSMELDPQKGWLTFLTAVDRQTFKIAKPELGPDKLCPYYQIRTVAAGLGYAIIRKVCPRNEYRAGRDYMSNDYYLFDEQSRTMRSIWSAATVISSAEFPAAKPEISVIPSSQGYHFRWVGMFPGDGFSKKLTISNFYKFVTDNRGTKKLVCYDNSDRKLGSEEGEMCRGEILDRVE